MFKYNPEELNEVSEGLVSFKVIDAKDKDQNNYPLITKDGQNNIIRLTLRVTDNQGGSSLINDNLVSNASWKVNHFLKSVGRSAWFKKGTLNASQLVNLHGQCVLKKKEYDGKIYMNVASYVEREQSEAVNNPTPDEDEAWGDIPF